MKAILISLLFWLLSAVVIIAPPVGSTSSWGVVYTRCAWCDGTNNLEIHHIVPQHIAPERAYDTNNLITLCRTDHLRLGHRGNWKRAVTNLLNMIKEGRK